MPLEGKSQTVLCCYRYKSYAWCWENNQKSCRQQRCQRGAAGTPTGTTHRMLHVINRSTIVTGTDELSTGNAWDNGYLIETVAALEESKRTMNTADHESRAQVGHESRKLNGMFNRHSIRHHRMLRHQTNRNDGFHPEKICLVQTSPKTEKRVTSNAHSRRASFTRVIYGFSFSFFFFFSFLSFSSFFLFLFPPLSFSFSLSFLFPFPSFSFSFQKQTG